MDNEYIEKQLECPICMEQLKKPKSLRCMHTFCQECLVPLISRRNAGLSGITCPTCRKKTFVSIASFFIDSDDIIINML